MNRLNVKVGLPVLLALALATMSARGDGGVVRLQAVQGPFLITIFTASELLQDGPVDVSVMVQDRDSSDPILDANVNLTFLPPGVSTIAPMEQTCSGSSLAGTASQPEPFTAAATRRQASNKLLYAAAVKFAVAGNWRWQISVTRGGHAVKMACLVPVGPPPGWLSGLLPYLVLPPLLVGLFALNQWLRRRLPENLAAEPRLVH
jgi:hypothetical protein